MVTSVGQMPARRARSRMHRETPKWPTYCRGVLGAVSLLGLLALRPAMTLACACDCNDDGQVTVDELLKGVNIALGIAPVGDCAAMDLDHSDTITVDELLAAVNVALTGCPADTATPTPTATPAETLTPTASPTASPTDTPTGVPTAVIETIVGNGLAGYTGDGNAPLDTALYLPQDITIGPDGLLYIVDWNNHRIRRLNGAGVIETVAGTGDLGSAQDGNALQTDFNHPTNVYFDPQAGISGMIISAWHNSEVKRVDLTTELMINVAGSGARSFGGDGGPAPAAALNLPSSAVMDSHGNLIISDQANFRLRIVDPSGTINTLCGDGHPGYKGDGGPCLAAEINSPQGQAAAPAGRITIDANDNIYIADTSNHAIRRVDGTTHVITTIAGTGQPGYSGDNFSSVNAQLNAPSDVALGPDGSLYVADTMNHVIRKITPPDGTGNIYTVVGTGQAGFDGDGGPPESAKLNEPWGLTVAANGDLYIADTQNQRIREVSTHFTGAFPTPKPRPTPEVIPCSDVVGSICTYIGTGEQGFNGDGLDRLATDLYWVFDIEFTPSGRRIVLDWNNHKVREILPDDTVKTIMGTNFVGDGPPDLSDYTLGGADPLEVNLNHPTDVQELPNGDLMVMCWHNHKIRTILKDTNRAIVVVGAGAGYGGDGGPATTTTDSTITPVALINQPPHGVVDQNGNLFFIDQRNQRIRVMYNFVQDRENATIDTVVGDPDPAPPGGLVKGGYNGDGVALSTKLSFPTGPNPEPSGGLALDTSVTPPLLYFSDTLNNRVRKVTFTSPDFKTGVVQTIAGTGDGAYGGDGGIATSAQINYPQDMELGPDGNLYFADANNNRVRMIDLHTGIISTVAGTGDKGYAGDGGPAVLAQLNRPFGIAFDQNGDLYISDTFNSRVRKVKR